MKFRAFFNEEIQPADECEGIVRNAIESANGVELASDPTTLTTDNGDRQNITVDFEVHGVADASENRSIKGRLNEFLMGGDGCDGLVQVD